MADKQRLRELIDRYLDESAIEPELVELEQILLKDSEAADEFARATRGESAVARHFRERSAGVEAERIVRGETRTQFNDGTSLDLAAGNAGGKVAGGSASAGGNTISRELFVQTLKEAELIDAQRLEQAAEESRGQGDAARLAKSLVEQGLLTRFQAQAALQGKASSLVYGEYVVLEKIGAGGMGQVFKAQHRRMKRIVALKVLSAGLTENAEAARRFQREVEAAARLHHPNVVTAFDAGEARGRVYLVMEYVDGGDLTSLVQDRGPLPVETALDYVAQAAQGLAYAHGEGIVHRDVKPRNLLVDSRGVVKVLDLGLARLETEQQDLTETGQIMGTVDYMAPEQAEDTRRADHRADVYSLGCTLCYLLTGQPPYPRESAVQRILAHREAPIPVLSQLRPDAPPALDGVLAGLLAKQPDDRISTMHEVIEALAICRGQIGTAPALAIPQATAAAHGVAAAEPARAPYSAPPPRVAAGLHTAATISGPNPASYDSAAALSADETARLNSLMSTNVDLSSRGARPARRKNSAAIAIAAFLVGGLGIAAVIALLLASSNSNPGADNPGDGRQVAEQAAAGQTVTGQRPAAAPRSSDAAETSTNSVGESGAPETSDADTGTGAPATDPVAIPSTGGGSTGSSGTATVNATTGESSTTTGGGAVGGGGAEGGGAVSGGGGGGGAVVGGGSGGGAAVGGGRGGGAAVGGGNVVGGGGTTSESKPPQPLEFSVEINNGAGSRIVADDPRDAQTRLERIARKPDPAFYAEFKVNGVKQRVTDAEAAAELAGKIAEADRSGADPAALLAGAPATASPSAGLAIPTMDPAVAQRVNRFIAERAPLKRDEFFRNNGYRAPTAAEAQRMFDEIVADGRTQGVIPPGMTIPGGNTYMSGMVGAVLTGGGGGGGFGGGGGGGTAGKN